MLKPVSNKVNFPAMEEEILRFCEDHQTFQKSVDQRRGGREYVFYDGPPFATGLPHYGHLLASTIKDIIPRYQAMRGHLVERRFAPLAPDRLWVADFTYVSTWSGWVYVAFVIDAYARRIIGWRSSTSMTAALVLDALEHAVWTRTREGRDVSGVIAHHDHGSQYTSVAYSERLAADDIRPSMGVVGSSYDNALAESIIGLFKTEVVRRHGPFRTVSDVEYALMEWCDWYNNARLHSRLGYLSPAEYEAAYYAQLSPRRPALV